MKYLLIDPNKAQAPTRDLPSGAQAASSLPDAKETKVHPFNVGGENASLLFVGTAKLYCKSLTRRKESASTRTNLLFD